MVKLKKYSLEESQQKITFRETIDNKEIKSIYFDKLKSLNSNSVISFFTETILRELSMSRINVNHFIYGKVKLFIKDYLFNEIVDLDDINVIRNLSEPQVTNILITTFIWLFSKFFESRIEI